MTDPETFAWECPPGTRITTAIETSIATAIAAKLDVPLMFNFNGVTIAVRSDSDPVLILRDWERAIDGCIPRDSAVGPYPNPVLTSDETAADEAIRAANVARAEAAQAQWLAKSQAAREALDLKLAGTAIELSNEPGWRDCVSVNADGGYGQAVVSYADYWARLMQMAMIEGASLEGVAESTSHEADVDGITGFQYGCAVSILAKTWIHGEALRRWHNARTQIGDEGGKSNESGGVLNPALISLGSDGPS